MIGALLYTVAIAANAYITGKVVQDPAIDYRFAIPVSSSETLTLSKRSNASSWNQGQDQVPLPPPTPSPQTEPAPNNLPGLVPFQNSPQARDNFEFGEQNHAEAKLTSKSFHSAAAADVLSWLEHEGVSFIIADDLVKSRSITMNIVNQPLSSAIEGIAAAMGGHWTHRGAIRVFESGMDGFGPMTGTISGVGLGQRADNPYAYYQVKPESRSVEEIKITGDPSSHVTINGKSVNLGKFIDSLTTRQKEILNSKGFLSRSDLTNDQISMLSLDKDRHTELRITVNGFKVDVRNP